MTALLEVDGVTVTFAGATILSDLCVKFPSGESTFIVGKSGSGKSTLLKVVAGLLLPDRGRVFFRGHRIAKFTRPEELAFRKISSFAFQDAALWANQSIYNNIALPLAVHHPELSRAEIAGRVQAAAERVGYRESLAFRPDTLSAGEQKLISFARAMVLDPDIYFMDEPTASLDEESVGSLLKIMLELKKAGKTLVVVSHDPRLIAAIADQLCIVVSGKVCGFGPAEKIAPLVGGELMKRIRQAREKAALDGLEAATVK